MSNIIGIKVGIRELKARLSHYMRMVKAGRKVVITRHGEPIGWILPYPETLEDQLRAATSSGIISWNGRRYRPAGPVARTKGNETVANIIVEDRR